MLIEGRKSRVPMYDAQHCHGRIREVCQSFLVNPIKEFTPPPKGFDVDVWLRKDGIDYFFDTKTVQPNVGNYSRYVDQIFNWYAYFYSRYPQMNAFARLVFPYNPYVGYSFWDKTKGRGWPLEPDNEGWVENQFWDFCSGIDNTYEIILSAFRDISEARDLQDISQRLFYGRSI